MKIKLQYLKHSKEINAWIQPPEARRQWNVLTPVPGYEGTVPTFSLLTLIELGLVPDKKAA